MTSIQQRDARIRLGCHRYSAAGDRDRAQATEDSAAARRTVKALDDVGFFTCAPQQWGGSVCDLQAVPRE